MECREPLFLPTHSNVPKQHANGLGPSAAAARAAQAPYNRGRYSPQPPLALAAGQTNAAPSPAMSIPLPVPKNVVLIALMEAAERQHKAESKKRKEEESEQETTDLEEDDEEEYNLDRIISGMSTLTGPCGTYVVKEAEGLAVVPNDPRKRVSVEAPTETEEKKEGSEDLKEEPELKEPFLLAKGQKVQVVSFSDGVAKLARGAGFICATSSQLVKVGQPQESVCRLEGLLETIESRGKDLQSALDENNIIEATIRKQIEAGLQEIPSFPIISELPKCDDILHPTTSKDQDDDQHALHHPHTPPSDHNAASSAGQHKTPHRTPPSTETELGSIENRLAFFGLTNLYPSSPNSIDNSDLPAPTLPNYRHTRDDDELNHFAIGCGAAFIGQTATASLFGESSTPRNDLLAGTTRESCTAEGRAIGPSRPRDAESPNHHFMMPDGPTLTSSFDTVDFRTGMSGHRGLNHTKPGHSPTPRGYTRLMMSEHRGIGRVRGPSRRQVPASAPSLGPRFSPLPHNGGVYEHHV